MTRQRFLPVATIATGAELDRNVSVTGSVSDLHDHAPTLGVSPWTLFNTPLNGWALAGFQNSPAWQIGADGFVRMSGVMSGSFRDVDTSLPVIALPAAIVPPRLIDMRLGGQRSGSLEPLQVMWRVRDDGFMYCIPGSGEPFNPFAVNLSGVILYQPA